MAEEKIKIVWRPKAQDTLQGIYDFVSADSVKNADDLINRMIIFGASLIVFPDKYPVCRFPRFARYLMHCATFEHNYIFVYKVVKSELLIYTIAHTKRMK